MSHNLLFPQQNCALAPLPHQFCCRRPCFYSDDSRLHRQPTSSNSPAIASKSSTQLQSPHRRKIGRESSYPTSKQRRPASNLVQASPFLCRDRTNSSMRQSPEPPLEQKPPYPYSKSRSVPNTSVVKQ
uniref:Uncharacterized protein n=1 Tax=Opuntia streptacantha TaxID=393608 RepID=A0A7C9DXC0_OPUST